MYESMFSALKPLSNDNSVIPKEMEIMEGLHKKEIEEIKQKNEKITKSLEKQIAEYKETNAEFEKTIKNLQNQKIDSEKMYQLKVAEAENKKKEYEDKLKNIDSERSKHKDMAILDSEAKVANANAEMERLRSENKYELEKTKQDCENTLREIKFIYEREKLLVESRLEKANAEIKLLQSKRSSCDTSRDLNELQNNYIEQIQELSTQLDAFKKQSEEDVALYKKQRDDAIKKVEELNRNQTYCREDYEELQTVKKQVVNLKSYVAKLENNEKLYKNLLEEQQHYEERKAVEVNLQKNTAEREHRNGVKQVDQQNGFEKIKKAELKQLKEYIMFFNFC